MAFCEHAPEGLEAVGCRVEGIGDTLDGVAGCSSGPSGCLRCPTETNEWPRWGMTGVKGFFVEAVMNDMADRQGVLILTVMLMTLCLIALGAQAAVTGSEAAPAPVLERARECYRQGDYGCAIQSLEQPVKARKLAGEDLIEAMELLARSYVQANRLLEGKAAFRELLCERSQWRPDAARETPEEIRVFFNALNEGPCVRPGSAGGEKKIPPPRKGRTTGVMLGLNVASVGGKGLDWAEGVAGAVGGTLKKKNTAFGMVAGGFVEFGMGVHFAVRPEVLWSQRGGGYEVQGPAGELYAERYTLNYVEVPVLLKLLLPSVGRMAPGLVLGPSVSMRLASHGKIESGAQSGEGNLNDWTEALDYGLVVGGGVKLASLRIGDVFVEGRYGLGLRAILKGADEQREIKNRTITVLTGIGF